MLINQKEDIGELIKGYWALGDFFSRLGGSARPLNMKESEMPTYIVCYLMKDNLPKFHEEDYIQQDFIKAAMPVLPEVHKHLDKISATGDDLLRLLFNFTEGIDAQLKITPGQSSHEWQFLNQYIKETVASMNALET